MQPAETLTPLDAIALAREATQREQAVAEAVRAIGNLRAATAALSDEVRDEAALQRCLTQYPVLFGLQYRAVVPKYRLGKDFEMDYALEQLGGFVDCVELEPSNLRLYTRAGNPTKELVHAEQQVLDWLEWLEANSRLARDDFPGLMRPLGQVVIGRRHSLVKADLTRLRRRNAAWRGSLAVLTYDDLLDRGLHMLDVLTRDAGSQVRSSVPTGA